MLLNQGCYRSIIGLDEKFLNKFLNFKQAFFSHKFFILDDNFTERLVVKFAFMRVNFHAFESKSYFNESAFYFWGRSATFKPINYDHSVTTREKSCWSDEKRLVYVKT